MVGDIPVRNRLWHKRLGIMLAPCPRSKFVIVLLCLTWVALLAPVIAIHLSILEFAASIVITAALHVTHYLCIVNTSTPLLVFHIVDKYSIVP